MSARGTTFVGSVCQVLPGFCPALHFRAEVFHPRVFFFPSLSANSQTRGTSGAGAGAAKHPELCWWGRCPSSAQHMSFQRASTHFPAVSAALMRENHFVWPALRKKVSLSSRKLSHHQLVEWRLGVLPSPIPRKICRNLANDVEKLFESSYSQSELWWRLQLSCPRCPLTIPGGSIVQSSGVGSVLGSPCPDVLGGLSQLGDSRNRDGDGKAMGVSSISSSESPLEEH